MVATQAGAGEPEQFVVDTQRFRPQLYAHCYRLMGSVDDAEDAVQETYLRAWRGYDSFEHRSSVRTWLFRIATNACLTALRGHRGEVLPAGLGGSADDLLDRDHPAWPRPGPDALPRRESDDPADVVALQDDLRRALLVSLMYLPARQRVVLILRDVLDWPASEVAELLETTTDAVKSTLKRARRRVLRRASVAEDVVEPVEPARRALLGQYVSAFRNLDTAALRIVLRHDAVRQIPAMAVA